jgi:large subunit ribosomal protein L17
MRHRIAGYKLGRDTEHRMAMRRNMAISLLTHEQITTTVPKAKSLQPFVERLITWARKGDLAARRRVLKSIGDPVMVKFDEDPDVVRNKYGELVSGPKLVKKLFDEIGPRFADRDGGYTRIVRLGKHRIGDASDLCVIQLVGGEEGPQVRGQYSRRRDKANRRMEFAAERRRQSRAAASPEPAAAEAPAPAPEAPAAEETPKQE